MSEADDEVEVSLFSSQSWPVLALFAVSIAVWIYIVYLIAKKVDPLAAGSSGKSSRKSKKKKPAKRGHRKHKDSDASSDSDDEPVAPKAAPPPAAKDASRPANDGKKAKGPPKPVDAPAHPLCFRTLAGLEDAPWSLSWSGCGGALAVACEDQMMRVFKLGEPGQKTPPAPVRVSTVRDPAAFAAFVSGTDSLVALTLGLNNALIRFGPEQPGKQMKQQWETKVPGNYAFRSFEAAPAGAARIAVACTDATQLLLLSPANGSLLATLDTAQLKNHMATLRPDGQLLACAAFTAVVKVWWLRFAGGGHTGSFEGAERVLEISQPAASCVGFSPDGKKLVTAAKDGIRVWDLGEGYVEHQKLRFHPPKCSALVGPEVNAKLASAARVALGPDDVVAAASGRSIVFVCARTGQCLAVVENAHEDAIVSLSWAPQGGKDDWGGGGGGTGSAGRGGVLASGGRDRKVRLWNAPQRSV